MTVVVQLFADEPVVGLWCHQCMLPSVTRTVIHVGSPASDTYFISHECEGNPEHVLIEDEP